MSIDEIIADANKRKLAMDNFIKAGLDIEDRNDDSAKDEMKLDDDYDGMDEEEIRDEENERQQEIIDRDPPAPFQSWHTLKIQK